MTSYEKKHRVNFSAKQKKVFFWWKNSRTAKYDGIICDGAIRSGKTFCMSMSFVIWACSKFSGSDFAICGKTITSVRRNLITPLLARAKEWGFSVKEVASRNFFELTLNGCTNRFYIFGGRDESSAALIQGITLCGILLDEVALMPRSFVEQAVARCSVTGSKLWFNCNPENQYHWFKKEWIDKAEEKNLLYLHFSMSDNPALSAKMIARYEKLYSGAFYQRFVLGSWAAAQGLVYPMFKKSSMTVDVLPNAFEKYAVSCDYGTVNPCSFGLWGLCGGIWYRISEYYFDSRREGIQRTDEEHYAALEQLCSGKKISLAVCDPSAASFIECVRRHGKIPVAAAKNDVISGIRRVGDALTSGRIKIFSGCADTIREFAEYRWDKSAGIDRPIKENDHAMDDIRYFVSRFLQDGGDGFYVLSLDRNE